MNNFSFSNMQNLTDPTCIVLSLANQLGPDETFKVVKALRRNTSILHIDLHGNPFYSKSGKAIAKVIRYNTTLRSLNLSNCNLELYGKMIAEALKENNTLTSLDLSLNNIQATEILQVLTHNTTLDSLDLSFNDLGPDYDEIIAEFLQGNKSLTTLKLSSNNLGCKEIMKNLAVNNTLTSLDLSFNKLNCLEEIVNVVNQNKKLFYLSLGNTNLSSNDINTITEARKLNTTLVLNLHQYHVS